MVHIHRLYININMEGPRTMYPYPQTLHMTTRKGAEGCRGGAYTDYINDTHALRMTIKWSIYIRPYMQSMERPCTHIHKLLLLHNNQEGRGAVRHTLYINGTHDNKMVHIHRLYIQSMERPCTHINKLHNNQEGLGAVRHTLHINDTPDSKLIPIHRPYIITSMERASWRIKLVTN